MLLKAAELLAAAGELPVNLRFACDGEEEVGGHSIVDWIQQDERGADAAVVFDGGMVERDVPAFNIAVRGLCYFHVKVRAGERDLHSGMYGGASLNAMHAIMQTLSGVLPRDGRVPEALRAGSCRRRRRSSRAGRACRRARRDRRGRSRPADAAAAEEFYLRTWAEPAVDVHGINGGSPTLQKTVIPVEADRERLDPARRGAGPGRDRPDLRAAAPGGGTRRRRGRGGDLVVRTPGARAPDAPASSSGWRRSRRCWACGRCSSARAARSRSSRSSPPVASPPILTGFALNESNIHSPNERIPRSICRWGSRPPPHSSVASRTLASAPFSSPLAAELATDVLERFLRYVRIDTQADEGLDDLSEHREAARPLAAARRRAAASRPRGCRADRARLRASRHCPARRGAPVDRADRPRRHEPEAPGAGVDADRARGLRRRRDRAPRRPEPGARSGRRAGRSPSASGTTSSPATGRRCSAPTTRPAWPRSWPRSPSSSRTGRAARATLRIAFTVDEEVGPRHRPLRPRGVRRRRRLHARRLGGRRDRERDVLGVAAQGHDRRARRASRHREGQARQRGQARRRDFVAACPRDGLSPETTEGREGFVHPPAIDGGGRGGVVTLIVRDHDDAQLDEHTELVRRLASRGRGARAAGARHVRRWDQYRNMRAVIDGIPQVVDGGARRRCAAPGSSRCARSIRGGTDGAAPDRDGPADAEPLHRRPELPLACASGRACRTWPPRPRRSSSSSGSGREAAKPRSEAEAAHQSSRSYAAVLSGHARRSRAIRGRSGASR